MSFLIVGIRVNPWLVFLKALVRVQQDRHWPIVYQFDFHHFLKAPGFAAQAGGLNPLTLPKAVRAVRGLYDTMHENRIKRLQLIGFSSGESDALSQSHTPNFM